MKIVCLAAFLLAVAASSAQAIPINAAEGKPVTITGEVGVITCCWPSGPVAPLSSIVDGTFLPEMTQWQTGTVWWDERHPPSFNNVIEIDLLGLYNITSLALQADNNDYYGISMRDRFDAWIFLGYFGPVPGFGMMTRSAPILLEASAFRIDADFGDAFYSVSEFQAIGEPVPEPATLLLFGSGLSALAARRKLKNRKR
jgi:PEP-CTERM motif-containing protein